MLQPSTRSSLPRPFPLMTLMLLAGYAFFTWQLSHLSSKWLIAMMGLPCAVLVLLITGNRRLVWLNALTLALPLIELDFSLFFDPRYGGNYRVSLMLLDLAMAALWLEHGISTPREQRRKFQPAALKWLFAGLLLLAVLSALNAKLPNLTFFESIRLLRMMLLAGIIATALNTPYLVRMAVVVLMITISLQGMLAAAQFIKGGTVGLEILGEKEQMVVDELGEARGVTRVGGTLGHPNRLARFFGLTLPLALALAIAADGKWQRRLAYLALCCGGVGVFFAFSRAAWLGVALGFVLVYAACLNRAALRAQAWRSLKVALFVTVPVAIVSIPIIIARFTSDDRGSFATRGPLAHVAMHIINERPMLGVGYGNYKEWLPFYGDPDVPFTFEQKVHNVYLLIAAEAGVASLLLYVLVLLTALRASLALMRRGEPAFAATAAGIFGGLAAYVIHGTVDYVEIGQIPILWFQFGLVAAMTKMQRNAPVAAAAPQRENPETFRHALQREVPVAAESLAPLTHRAASMPSRTTTLPDEIKDGEASCQRAMQANAALAKADHEPRR